MKITKNDPALPCMPIQDSLGRLTAPIPGFTKYQYVVLEIYKELINKVYNDHDSEFTSDGVMLVACEMADTYFNILNQYHARQEMRNENKATIIQS
jgi:hypothetical protein